jgi:hypothetical protein
MRGALDAQIVIGSAQIKTISNFCIYPPDLWKYAILVFTDGKPVAEFHLFYPVLNAANDTALQAAVSSINIIGILQLTNK